MGGLALECGRRRGFLLVRDEAARPCLPAVGGGGGVAYRSPAVGRHRTPKQPAGRWGGRAVGRQGGVALARGGDEGAVGVDEAPGRLFAEKESICCFC